MMDILKLSCIENMDIDCDETEEAINPYLERSDAVNTQTIKMSKEEQAIRIKNYFSQLVSEGMTPNDAVVKAINAVAKEVSSGVISGILLLPSNLKGTKQTESKNPFQVASSASDLKDILLTTKKYVKNVQKQPYNPKFRCFRLSNKFFDKITSTEGGLDYVVKDLGFRTYNTSLDFMASIPLSTDIDVLEKRIDDILEKDS